MTFADRTEAGRELGAAVAARLRPDEDAVVFGLPRGGVIVAAEVVRLTGKPLDIIVVREIGAPESEEVAIGAVGEEGKTILYQAAIGECPIPDQYVAMATTRAREEVQRRVAAHRRPSEGASRQRQQDSGVMHAVCRLLLTRLLSRLRMKSPLACTSAPTVALTAVDVSQVDH